MKRFTMFLIAAIISIGSMVGQVDITVTDGSSNIEGVNVTVNSITVITDVTGVATFDATGWADDTYDVTTSFECYENGTGTVDVTLETGTATITISPKTTNDVFFFLGMMGAEAGVTVNLNDGAGFNESYTAQGTPMEDVVINDVPYGSYTYTISKECATPITGTIDVDCNSDMGTAVYDNNPALKTTNDVFFFLGMMGAEAGVTVNLNDGAGFSESYTAQGTPMEDVVINDVPYGSYTYTISKECATPITGTIDVDCNSNMGTAVYDNNPALKTTNDVFFFLGMMGAEAGVTVNLNDGAGFNESYTAQGTPMEDVVINDVPYGSYTYTISKECATPITGTIDVDCNSDMGTAVYDNNPALKTTNDVFFFLGMMGAEAGVTVNLNDGDGFNESYIAQGTPMEDVVINDVPYGSYTYTISKECATPITGTIEVDCNSDMGAAVYNNNPSAIIIDNTVTQDGDILTANQDGMSYQWIDVDDNNTPIDGATGQSYTVSKSGNYAVTITNGTCGFVTSDPINVTVTDIYEVSTSKVLAYPNPASNFITVKLESIDSPVTITLLSTNGGVIRNLVTEQVETTVNLSDLSNGVYFIQVNRNGEIQTIKFIKK